MIRIKATWIKDQEFTGNHEDNEIRIDGNKKNGHGPKALLLSGLAACSGIDVVEILEKMRVDFDGFFMEVETEQTEEHPKVFRDILIIYHIRTDPANEHKVRRAIDLSLNNYCGVSAMLKKNSRINYRLEIEK